VKVAVERGRAGVLFLNRAALPRDASAGRGCRLACTNLRRLGGRPPLQRRLVLQPFAALEPRPPAKGPNVRRPRAWSRSVRSRAGGSRRRPRCFRIADILVLSSALVESSRAFTPRNWRASPRRFDISIGTQLVARAHLPSQPGRGHRRRARPRQRRSTRRRAHLSNAESGDLARRARGRHGARAICRNPPGPASGDAGALLRGQHARRSTRARSRLRESPALYRRSEGLEAFGYPVPIALRRKPARQLPPLTSVVEAVRVLGPAEAAARFGARRLCCAANRNRRAASISRTICAMAAAAPKAKGR